MEQPVRAQPPTFYIALTDILSAAGILFPIVFFLIGAGITLVSGIDEARGYWFAAGLSALVGFPLAWWRVRMVRETITTGVEVEGVVTFLRTGSGKSGNTRVKWEYKVGGQTYRGEAYVSVTSDVRPPQPGAPIGLWVHPRKPQWSLWRALYAALITERP